MKDKILLQLNYSTEIPLYLKLAYVESYPLKDESFDGKMTGWITQV